MKINTTEGAGRITHEITVCFEGNCPAANSITIVKLGAAEVKIRSAGGTAEVSKKPVGASSYQPYEVVNWVDHDDYCCVTFTWTEVEAGLRAALTDAFSFDQRGFAQSVSLAEVVRVLHSVAGVVFVDVDVLRRFDQTSPDLPDGGILRAEGVRWADTEPEPGALAQLLIVNPFGIALVHV